MVAVLLFIGKETMITASEARALSRKNKTLFTQNWFENYLEEAVKTSAKLGYNEVHFYYIEPGGNWHSYDKDGRFFCPWSDDVDWEYVRELLIPLGYKITDRLFSDQKTIVYISW